jgi:hypothetical protein
MAAGSSAGRAGGEDRRVSGLVTTQELRLALLHARLRTSQPAGNGR